MSPVATIRSLHQARRVIKRMMNAYPEVMEDVSKASREGVRRAVEELMEHRRARYLEEQIATEVQDRGNGHYRRHLLTGIGDIDLQVPRTRRWSAVEVLHAYARRAPEVDRCILASFVLGLSTRKATEALLPILGERISASTVSRVAKALDTAVESYHKRPLCNRYRVLQFDGVVLARKSGHGVQRRPVLVVLGILPDKRREVIDFLLAPNESQEAWEGLLNELNDRGLTGEGVELITIDGCPGLARALQVVHPRIPVQRCWAHKVRNILDRLRKGDREEARRGLRKIYGARSRFDALKGVIRFGARWEATYPQAVGCLMKDLEELLVFFGITDPDWRRMVRTTNAIERRFREVRRRTRPMGVFTDRDSVERILFAVFEYENRKRGLPTLFLVTQNS
jgi:putative transposase